MVHHRAEIERYLTEGLPPAAEDTLRGHLRTCPTCREFYDSQVLLLRALAGRPTEAPAREAQRTERLALAAAGLTAAPPAPGRTRTAWWEFVHAGYWRLGAAALAGVLLVAIALEFSGRPVTSATVVKARGLTVAGRPAKAGATILSDEPLVVSPQGFAEVAIELGGTLRLFPKTSARLQGRGTGVEVTAGRVWCRIDPATPEAARAVPPGQARFRAFTDRGEARVLGTSFVVEKLPSGAMEVRVLSGKVAVEDARHQGVVEVLGGQKTRVDLGPPAPAQPYAGEDAEEWTLAGFFKQVGRAIKSLFE